MNRYVVIGTDGREYGPVTAEQIRDWLRDQRVNAGTSVRLEGESEWRPLQTISEFAAERSLRLGAGPAPMSTSLVYRQTNSWAVAGFVFGLLSFILGFCCCCCVPFDLIGILCSVVGLVQIYSNPETQTGTGLAIAGLVLSLFGLVVGLAVSALSLVTGGMEELMHEVQRELGYAGAALHLG